MWGRKEGEKKEGETNYTFSNFFLSRIAALERVFVHVVSMHFKKSKLLHARNHCLLFLSYSGPGDV